MDGAALKENRKKKNELLRQMLALTEQQLSQLAAEEMEQFSQTVKSWEALSTEVGELEAAFQSASAGGSAGGGAGGGAPTPNGWAVELGMLNDESRRLLLEIRGLQEQCSAQAEKSMGKYKSDMKDAQKSFQRVTSYVTPYAASEDGIYFDQKK